MYNIRIIKLFSRYLEVGTDQRVVIIPTNTHRDKDHGRAAFGKVWTNPVIQSLGLEYNDHEINSRRFVLSSTPVLYPNLSYCRRFNIFRVLNGEIKITDPPKLEKLITIDSMDETFHLLIAYSVLLKSNSANSSALFY